MVAGSYIGVESGDFRVLRFNIDGTVDTTFGVNGFVNYNIRVSSDNTFAQDVVYGVKTLSDNKIIVSGYSSYFGDFSSIDFVMIKLNSDGSLDTSFANDGKLIDNYFGGAEIFPCLTIDSNDNIFVGGQSFILTNTGFTNDIAIGKYNSNGVPDATFGTLGKVITISNTGSLMTIQEIAIAENGKIICSGTVSSGDDTTQDLLLVKYTANGVLDTSFDSDGIFVKDFNMLANFSTSLKIKSDGKILCGGAIVSGTLSGLDSALIQFSDANLSTSQLSTSQFSVSPNPFSDCISLSFGISESQVLDIDLYDINGRKIQNLISKKKYLSGNNHQKLNLSKTLSKGIYFLNITDGYKTQSIKIVK